MQPLGSDPAAILIHAPFGRDAQLTAHMLADAGLQTVICRSFAELCVRIGSGGGVALVVQEALTPDCLAALAEILSSQPGWSDFPLIILAQRAGAHDVPWPSLNELGSVGHAILLERPIRVETLVSAVQVALRSRRRQYELAEHLAQREEAERQITAAYAEAAKANLSKSNFLASASHDLRQPFQAMRLYQQLLEQQVTDPASRKILALLGQSMGSGEELLNALLDVSTLEAGKVQPSQATILASDVVGSVVADLAPLAAAKGLRLRARTKPSPVQSDPVMLKRLVRNLVVNAVRYTETGGVLVACRSSKGMLRIEVWDTGIGIPSDKFGAIFEDFVQLGNEERDRSKGIGLGLAIVARMAHLLGHRLDVRSRPGRGSVFVVTVPIAGAAQAFQ